MKTGPKALHGALLAALLTMIFLVGLSAGHDVRARMLLMMVESNTRYNLSMLSICRKKGCPEGYTEVVLAENERYLGRYAHLEGLDGAGLRGYFAMDEAIDAAYPELDLDKPADNQRLLEFYEQAGVDIDRSRKLLEEAGLDPPSSWERFFSVFSVLAIVVAALVSGSHLLTLAWRKTKSAPSSKCTTACATLYLVLALFLSGYLPDFSRVPIVHGAIVEDVARDTLSVWRICRDAGIGPGYEESAACGVEDSVLHSHVWFILWELEKDFRGPAIVEAVGYLGAIGFLSLLDWGLEGRDKLLKEHRELACHFTGDQCDAPA